MSLDLPSPDPQRFAQLPVSVQQAIEIRLPTRKERLIHRRVCIEGRFPEEVARAESASLERVKLIATNVQQWLVPVQADVDSHRTSALHLERLEHQWLEAMSAWYRSGQEEQVVKISFEGRERADKCENVSPPAQANDATAAPAAETSPEPAPAAPEPPTKSRAKSEKANGKQKVERTTRGGGGDVRYLEQARRIMAEIRELTAVVEKQTQAQREADVDQLTADQRNQSAARSVVPLRERQHAIEDHSAADAGDDAASE